MVKLSDPAVHEQQQPSGKKPVQQSLCRVYSPTAAVSHWASAAVGIIIWDCVALLFGRQVKPASGSCLVVMAGGLLGASSSQHQQGFLQ